MISSWVWGKGPSLSLLSDLLTTLVSPCEGQGLLLVLGVVLVFLKHSLTSHRLGIYL